MRISDWSSDVCSSDLLAAHGQLHPAQEVHLRQGDAVSRRRSALPRAAVMHAQAHRTHAQNTRTKRRNAKRSRSEHMPTRSEERRGGKEWVSKCRSRWSPSHLKKKNRIKIKKKY